METKTPEQIEQARVEMRERMRRKVLKALDSWSKEEGLGRDQGWRDGDLPNLFRALDSHFETVTGRLYIPALLEKPF